MAYALNDDQLIGMIQAKLDSKHSIATELHAMDDAESDESPDEVETTDPVDDSQGHGMTPPDVSRKTRDPLADQINNILGM